MRKVICVLLLVISIFLTGCENEADHIRYDDYKNIEYFITSDESSLPFLFSSKNQIENLSIIEVNGIETIDFDYDFIIEETNGNPLVFNEYYVYGIIFDFEDSTINDISTLKVKYNEGKTFEFSLNIRLKHLNIENDNHILPTFIPMEYIAGNDIKYGFLANADIQVIEISFYSNVIDVDSVTINSEDFFEMSVVSFQEGEQMVVTCSLLNKTIYDEYTFDKIYLHIIYEFDGETYNYVAPFTYLGSLEQNLKNILED